MQGRKLKLGGKPDMKKTGVMSCSLLSRMRVSECSYPVNVTREFVIYVSYLRSAEVDDAGA